MMSENSTSSGFVATKGPLPAPLETVRVSSALERALHGLHLHPALWYAGPPLRGSPEPGRIGRAILTPRFAQSQTLPEVGWSCGLEGLGTFGSTFTSLSGP